MTELVIDEMVAGPNQDALDRIIEDRKQVRLDEISERREAIRRRFREGKRIRERETRFMFVGWRQKPVQVVECYYR